MMKYINGVEGAPQALGPYSQAVICENTVYLSGQVPIDPETGALVEGGIEGQADQVMKNLSAVLAHIGLDFSHVLKATIYLADLADFAKVNAVYAEWLGAVKPARATVQVAGLPLGARVEIEMIAVLSSMEAAMLPPGSVKELEQEFSEQSYSVGEKNKNS